MPISRLLLANWNVATALNGLLTAVVVVGVVRGVAVVVVVCPFAFKRGVIVIQDLSAV